MGEAISLVAIAVLRTPWMPGFSVGVFRALQAVDPRLLELADDVHGLVEIGGYWLWRAHSMDEAIEWA